MTGDGAAAAPFRRPLQSGRAVTAGCQACAAPASAPVAPVKSPAEPDVGCVPAVPSLGDERGSAGDLAGPAELDRRLLRRVASADRQAFHQLYMRYHPRLSRFLFRILRRREDAEDTVHEVMLLVWQHAATFRGASLVSTWIFGIGYRCALKLIRRSAVRARSERAEVETRSLTTDDASLATENRQLLDFGLSRLPVDQRLVLVLAYEMDCSCDEIAAITECPVNTVKTRMFHARRKLRVLISGAAAQPLHPSRAGDFVAG